MKKGLFSLLFAALLMLPTAMRAQNAINTFPWTDDFSDSLSTMATWTVTDLDTDTYSWEWLGAVGNNGNGCMYTYVTPGDMMISPAFVISGSDMQLTFFSLLDNFIYQGYYSYPPAYKIMISTTGNSPADFTDSIYGENLVHDWGYQHVSLANYANQTIYIAFVATGIGYVYLDDMRIGGPTEPILTLAGPAVAVMNDSVTYTASSDATSFRWHVDGVQDPAATTATYTTAFTTAGSHMVVAEAYNTVGSAFDTIMVNVVDCSTAINTFPHTEGFEADIPCWTMISNDPANDNEFGIYADNTAPEGSYSFRFSSYGRATDYNQYLISPELDMPANQQYILKFKYKAANVRDSIRILASTTHDSVINFTDTIVDITVPATTWTDAAYILPAGTKYVAFNYYAPYMYYMYIDEVVFDVMGAPSVSLSGDTNVGSSMPVTYSVATTLADSIAWHIDGSHNAAFDNQNFITTTFTTAGQHTVVAEAINTMGSNYDTLYVTVIDCESFTLPYAAEFNGNLGCWFSESRRTVGYGWYTSDYLTNPVGQVFSVSASNSYFGMNDIDVDNWLISPAISRPAGNTSYDILWQVKSLGASGNYPSDHYALYTISGTDTVMLYEETLTLADSVFGQRAVTLPTTITGNFRIAFRHYGSTGGYIVVLDSIMIDETIAPIVRLNGPTSIVVDDVVEYVAVSGNATSYAWTVDGATVTANGDTLTHTFTTAGQHTVKVVATNAAGSTEDSLVVNAISCTINQLPYNEDFESDIDCWTIAYDGGVTFAHYNEARYAQYTHAGNGFMYSGSQNYAADAWLISPKIEIPQNADNIVFSYYMYAATTYEVLVSMNGGSDMADFNTAQPLFTENISNTGYELRSIDLSSLAGNTVRIAIRNRGAAGANYIYLDDIAIREALAPVYTISGNTTADINEAVELTAVRVEGDRNVTYNWTSQNGTISGSGATVTVTYTAACVDQVSLTVSSANGTYTATHQITVCGSITEFPYTEGFENDATANCWDLSNKDDEYGFLIFTKYTNNNGEEVNYSHTGDRCLFGNYTEDAAANQYAISPAIVLPANATDFELSWYEFTNVYAGIPTKYEVLLSTTGKNVADFTTRLFEIEDSARAYVYRHVSLANYAGQTIYIAFHNITSMDGNSMMIDDIRISSANDPANGIDDVMEAQVAVYPNPTADVINVKGEGIVSVEVMDVNGRIVATRSSEGIIDLGSMAAGVYMVRTVTAEGTATQRIIKN